MCGITGWINWEGNLTQPEKQAILERMGDCLTCRGPDASGIWVTRQVGFAHTRLVVVDPEGGAQPMKRGFDGREYVIVYNGELYNTEDVRKDLIEQGHTFRSHSDTEVLLHAYVEWGPDCVDRLNGIFAFAIWDEAEKQLFMARDRIGVKPLFFAKRGNSFVFGSELKSVIANPLIEPVLDEEGLGEIFALGPSRTPGHGVFKGVEELRPGHALLLQQDRMHTYPYWKLESKPHQDDFNTTVEKVRHLFIDSVERQLVSDVPVCTFLSGGLDSSAITAIAAGAFERDGRGLLHAYSIDYVGNDQYFEQNQFQPDQDDPWAEIVARYLGVERYKVNINTPQLMDSLLRGMRARDLPGMADVDTSLLLFCEEVKKEATVALSGECADEIFGGYPWFYREDLLASETFPWMQKWINRFDLYSDDLAKRMKPKDYLSERYRQALDEVPRLEGESKTDDQVREMFYLNLTRWMPTLLDRKDRMSMAVGLEVRVPFCDHRLVEYMWNVPWSMKYHGQQAKGLLRKALSGILPDDVLNRKKSPFPKTHNPAYLAATRQGVLNILDDPSSPLLAFVNEQKLRSFIDSDLHKEDWPWFGQLMNVPQLFAYLMQVNEWFKEYKVQVE